MQTYETKFFMVQALRFDRYKKPWPHEVETIVGDVGIPHPVIIGVQGNMSVNHGDWIVYMPMGAIVMSDAMFNQFFIESKHGDVQRLDTKPYELSQVHPLPPPAVPTVYEALKAGGL